MEVDKAGWSWVQTSARFSNTRFGFQNVTTIQTLAKKKAATNLEILDSNNAEPFYQSWKGLIANSAKYTDRLTVIIDSENRQLIQKRSKKR